MSIISDLPKFRRLVAWVMFCLLVHSSALSAFNSKSYNKSSILETIPNTFQCGDFGVKCTDNIITKIVITSAGHSGTIPSSIGLYTNLVLLNFGNSSIIGSIPTEIGFLTKLTSLTLSSNSLDGTIPTELGNLRSLKALYLGSNDRLTGTIPSSFGQMTSLTQVSLANADLIGSIPTQLGNLAYLIVFFINSNRISGTLPKEMGKLVRLEYFGANDNKLVGSIPREFSNLLSIKNLRLTSNNLCGDIPPQLTAICGQSCLFYDADTPLNSCDTSTPSSTPSIASSRTPIRPPTTSIVTTSKPTVIPSRRPSSFPTSVVLSSGPSIASSRPPIRPPTAVPTSIVTTSKPTVIPSRRPTSFPTSVVLSSGPSIASSRPPIRPPTAVPTSIVTTSKPTVIPSRRPTSFPTSVVLSSGPSIASSRPPIRPPTAVPTSIVTTSKPTVIPSRRPTSFPTSFAVTLRPNAPTRIPTAMAISKPTERPSNGASRTPTAIATTRKPVSSPSNTPSVSTVGMWSSQAGDLHCTRSINQSETSIRSSTLNLSVPTYFWETGGSVQTAPGVFGDYVIFPTSVNGKLSCFRKSTGSLVWEIILGDFFVYKPKEPYYSRSTPAFYGGTSFFIGIYGPCEVFKMNIFTGALEGRVVLSNDFKAIILQSGTIYGDRYLVGTASFEEGLALRETYKCCTFVGIFYSIDARTMVIQWSWRTIPLSQSGTKLDNKLSGNGIWGSSPAVDAETGIVYIATGNNYMDNNILLECIAKYPNQDDWEEQCHQKLFPENWFDSVVALDIATGSFIWGKRLSPWDAWHYGCENPPIGENCPKVQGKDYDFGMGATLSTLGVGGKKVLYISQKSGMSFCLDAADGSVIWNYQSSPGGHYGGHNWGISVDDKHVYVGIINQDHEEWILKNGTVFKGGGWAALDKVTGNPVWTTANPAAFDLLPGRTPSSPLGNGRAFTSFGMSPPMAIGDIVLVGSTDCGTVNDPQYGYGGFVYALNKTDGRILSSFETKASVYGGFSASQNCVFVGSGGFYKRGFSVGKGAYAWCV